MTKQDDEWGPWIEHDGSGLPLCVVARTIEVKAITNHGEPQSQIGYVDPQRLHHEVYRAWNWSFYAKESLDGTFGYSKIIRYRIRKPRALIEMIERAESLPQTKPQEVDA